MNEVFQVRSEPEDGLLGLVNRAEREITSASRDPIGVLEIALQGAPQPNLDVSVEATFCARKSGTERLDVHLSLALDALPEAKLVRAALAEFGGTAFTSVCVGVPDTRRDLVDCTVYFGSRLKFLAKNTALLDTTLSSTEIEAVRATLQALGSRYALSARTLVVPSTELRRPISVDAQVKAFLDPLERGFRSEIYAATLPPNRQVRLAAMPRPRGVLLHCAFCRSLSADGKSSAGDAVALRDFIAREFGFEFGGKTWRVTNSHGQRQEFRPHGPMGDSKPIEWSLNWGARRR